MTEIKSIFIHIDIPNLSEDKPKLCAEDLTEKYLCDPLRNDKYKMTNLQVTMRIKF